MTHDPFQTIPTLGSYAGMMGSALPYGAPQTPAINPAAALNALAASLNLSAMAQAGGASQLGQHGYPGHAGQSGLGLQQQLAPAFLSQPAFPQPQGLQALATSFQNPLLASVLSNPLVLASLQNPAVSSILAALASSSSPQLGWQQQQQYPQIGQNNSPFPQMGGPFGGQAGSPFGQQFGGGFGQFGSPYSQIGSPFALAPQSWIGQGGLYGGAQQFGQINPLLSQWSGRPFQASGISPWGY